MRQEGEIWKGQGRKDVRFNVVVRVKSVHTVVKSEEYILNTPSDRNKESQDPPTKRERGKTQDEK